MNSADIYIAKAFQATTPSLANPSTAIEPVKSTRPPSTSYFTVGAAGIGSESFRCIHSSYSIGGNEPGSTFVEALVVASAAQEAANPEWSDLRMILALGQVNGNLLLDNGESVRFYNMESAGSIKTMAGLDHTVFVRLEGTLGSVRT